MFSTINVRLFDAKSHISFKIGYDFTGGFLTIPINSLDFSVLI